jgi:hypothetical protein
MPMTIGTGSFSPGGRFAFPRSYIAGVNNYSAGFTLTQSLNQFTLDFHPTFSSVYHWTFDIDFWFLTSNCWTLDHIITECWYNNAPGDPQIPLDFGLRWQRLGPDFHPVLQFAPNNNFTTPIAAIISTIIAGYWTIPT